MPIVRFNPVSTGNSGNDDIAPGEAGLSISLNYGFDETDWDRIGAQPNNADGIAVDTANRLLKTAGFMYGFNGATLDRLRSDGNDAVTLAETTLGNLQTLSFSYAHDGANWQRLNLLGAGDSQAGKAGLIVNTQNYAFNETNFDRLRNNSEETLLASAARTATTNSADFTNFNAKGLTVIIDVSALAATPSITVNLQGKDPISGNYYIIASSPVISTVSTNKLTLYPGIEEVANQKISDILPRIYRINVVHGDADSITYSVSGALVV